MNKIFLTIVAVIILLTSCKQEKKDTVTTPPKENIAFNQFLKEYNEGKLKLTPINATFAGDNRFNDQFPNTLSSDYQIKNNTFYKNYKSQLANFKNIDLNESQKMSKAVLNWDCDMALAQASFKNDLLMPINQMWTINLTMGQLGSGSSAQPFKTVKDYQNWLSRLNGFYDWLESAIKNMRQGSKEGYVLPKSLINKIIPQFKVLAETKVPSHLFYLPIKNFPKDFSDADKKTLKDAYTSMLNDKLIPIFNLMYTFLKTDYLNAGRESSGISDVPNGEAYYNHSIKNYTTTKMTADEIHKLGLSEVARILAEMEKVKEQVAFKGSLKAFFNNIRENKDLMPYTTPKQIIDNFNS
jgi:uncharacterized protein (DUF885 family)